MSKRKNGRGGVRPGAGRKPIPDADRLIQGPIYLAAAEWAAFDAAHGELSRSDYVRKLMADRGEDC